MFFQQHLDPDIGPLDLFHGAGDPKVIADAGIEQRDRTENVIKGATTLHPGQELGVAAQNVLHGGPGLANEENERRRRPDGEHMQSVRTGSEGTLATLLTWTHYKRYSHEHMRTLLKYGLRGLTM